MAPIPDLVLYARPGCHLCDEAREAIGLVLADRRERGLAAPELVERNIEDDADLHRRLMERIPVVELGRERIELVVSVGKLRRLLNEVVGNEVVATVPTGNADGPADRVAAPTDRADAPEVPAEA